MKVSHPSHNCHQQTVESRFRGGRGVKLSGVETDLDAFQRGKGRRGFDLPPRTSPPSKLDSEPFEVHSTG